MLNLIGKITKAWIGTVSRKDARLGCFRIDNAKSAIEEPAAGNFEIKSASWVKVWLENHCHELNSSIFRG
jgi:hypothetical protein